MIGKWFIQIVAHVQSDTEPIRNLAHQQALGTDIFKKHHQLQLKKHDRINGWSSGSRVGLAHQVVDKREVKNLLQMAIKVILGNELLQGDSDQWRKCPLFETHHDWRSSLHPITPRFPIFCQLSSPAFYFLYLITCFTCFSSREKSSAVKLIHFIISSAGSFSTGWTILRHRKDDR